MTLLWLVAVAALASALIAWRRARATARRLEQLSQMYWELKYQQGELRVQLRRLADGEAPGAAGGSAEASRMPAAPPAEQVIPLSSLKR